ncbi:MAG: hypothetical protein IGQ45_08830 [Cyanobacterium sp. T60_A2020_053]|nr:hypothetical protein [Cyanobacterium sp. T60_A2020_053]
MNQVLNQYKISLEFLDVSGMEYLDLLSIRDELANLTFTDEEQKMIAELDQILVKNSSLIYQELSRFIDLTKYRPKNQINPQQWWWYLDVLSYLPVNTKSFTIKQDTYSEIA